jgi:hypothetical protein
LKLLIFFWSHLATTACSLFRLLFIRVTVDQKRCLGFELKRKFLNFELSLKRESISD